MLQNSSNRSLVFYLVLFSIIGSLLVSTLIVMLPMIIPNHENSIWYLRISIILQDIFVLFLPAYSIFKLSSNRPIYMLRFRNSNNMTPMLFYTLLIYLLALPAASVMAQWNANIVFPDALKGLEIKFREMEDSAKAVTDTFLSGTTINDLLINVAIVAGLAAIVEEVFFRGGLQQLLYKWFGKGHLSVWITAFIFSAIHLQFYGFIPRLFMGAVLGYLFYYSRNLWIPIFYHFVNNAFIVIINFFWADTNILKAMEESTLTWYSWVSLFMSLALTYFMFIRFSKISKKR